MPCKLKHFDFCGIGWFEIVNFLNCQLFELLSLVKYILCYNNNNIIYIFIYYFWTWYHLNTVMIVGDLESSSYNDFVFLFFTWFLLDSANCVLEMSCHCRWCILKGSNNVKTLNLDTIEMHNRVSLMCSIILAWFSCQSLAVVSVINFLF